MGIDIVLENEEGVELSSVSDPQNLLAGLLPAIENRNFRCLSFVDPYMDTVFNKLQMRELSNELRLLVVNTSSEEQRMLLAQIEALIQRGLSEISPYLKFYGD